jgi:hypothetical protein
MCLCKVKFFKIKLKKSSVTKVSSIHACLKFISHLKLRIIIAFNESTGDLRTRDRQRQASFDRFKSENYLGSRKWMAHWRGK